MHRKYNLNEFTLSKKELQNRVDNYESLKQSYKQVEHSVINSAKIKVAFSEAIKNGK